MPIWNPDQYLQFRDERTRPAIDLVQRIDLAAPARIIDLGCGTGTSTILLQRRWPEAQVIGLDSSEDMLQRARVAYPDLTWQQADIATWVPEMEYDLVFSNAALQWINPIDRMLDVVMKVLVPGGAFAFQVPNNAHSPYHLSILEVARRPHWKQQVSAAMSPLRYDDMSFYYARLAPHCSRLDLWETTYFQVVDSAKQILDWAKGSGLRPYLQALRSTDEQEKFERELLDVYRAAFPPAVDGKVLFPFRRQFVVAYK